MFRDFHNSPKLLTLTYDRKNHTMEAIEHFFADYSRIKKHILRTQIVFQYGLWCELTGAGQLHWHIIVDVKDIIKFKIACGWWAKNRGFTDVRPVTDLDKLSNEYLNKERQEMEEYLFRGALAPSFPLRDTLDPSIISHMEELWLEERRSEQRKKTLIIDLKRFQEQGKQNYNKKNEIFIPHPSQ